jgi:predicted amidohydrolase
MKKGGLYTILILLLFTFFQTEVKGNKLVRIAAIGGGKDRISYGGDPQVMVNQMISYLKMKIEKVLVYKPDLILLSELCDLPDGMTAQEELNYIRTRKNQILDFFAAIARENHCYIAFGSKREDHGFWNSCILLDREGKIAGIYDKNYPTLYEMEAGIQPSGETPVFQCDFGRVGCIICFDLNFDELREKYQKLQPDILLFSSVYHGGLEQRKWAYSCRSYFVCACGNSALPSEIRNPFGDVIASSTNYLDYAVTTVNLDRQMVHLDYNREKLIALKKKYGNEVTIDVPAKIGAALITSEKEGLSAEQMAREFKMVSVDDYFNQSREQRYQKLEESKK